MTQICLVLVNEPNPISPFSFLFSHFLALLIWFFIIHKVQTECALDSTATKDYDDDLHASC